MDDDNLFFPPQPTFPFPSKKWMSDRRGGGGKRENDDFSFLHLSLCEGGINGTYLTWHFETLLWGTKCSKICSRGLKTPFFWHFWKFYFFPTKKKCLFQANSSQSWPLWQGPLSLTVAPYPIAPVEIIQISPKFCSLGDCLFVCLLRVHVRPLLYTFSQVTVCQKLVQCFFS